ncbi:MAG: hypothetical protein Q9163_002877 [Psora crenata]
MKASSIFTVLCLTGQQAWAFPSILSEAMLHFRDADPQAERSQFESQCPYANGKHKAESGPTSPFTKRQASGIMPPFDASQQYVSNTGAHQFIAPSGNDQRGPCPGLNAMANHGYLPRSGVGKMQDFIDGTAAVFGMAADLSTLLAVYGAVFDGDLTSYSIGGPVNSLLNLGGLLGAPQGLSGSHNNGNDYLLQLSQFEAIYELGQQNSDSIDLDILTSQRATRFQNSIDNNPYFFNAPFSGLAVTSGAWTFIYRLMANKSSEHPEGLLTGNVLKSFYAVTGDYPNFQYTPGHERIPDNWYKRNLVDYYTILDLIVDINLMALQHPEFLSVGGNTGTIDSFVGVDLQNLTGGVYSASSLLQGNNAICFALQASLQEAPDILSKIFADVSAALDKLGSAVGQATDGLGCPVLSEINSSQFDMYPGYTKLKSNGQY